MEFYNNILCVQYSEICEMGLISCDHLKKLCARNQIRRISRGSRGNPARYAVDSFPERFRAEIYKRLPVPEKQKQEARQTIEGMVIDQQAVQFFAEFQLPDGRHLKPEQQEIYINEASILNTFCDEITECDNMHRRAGNTPLPRKEIFENLSKRLNRIADIYPHSLPEFPRRLQNKYNEYMKTGYSSLISNKFLNGNAAAIDSQDKENVLVQLMSDRRNLDNEQIASLYNMLARGLKWKEITGATVANYRKKHNLVTYAGNHGATEFRNTKTMQVKRTAPTAPLLYWSIDGWDVELLYQKTTTDNKGNNVTTYHNRLTVVVVLDTFNNYPVGYAIGTHETPALIKTALCNAVNHTAQLFGTRYRAHQLQSDHYAIKTLAPIYSVVADKVTPARVKNAKAKVIEPYFKSINKKYCQLMPNWSGFGVTAKKSNQPNTEAINISRHNFPDLQGCVHQIAFILEKEREQKCGSFIKAFNQLADKDKLGLSYEQFLWNFGVDTGNKNALEGSGLNITIDGIKRTYDCFDARFREHSHVRWTVLHDPGNLDTVLAVNQDATLRFVLERKYTQPMALHDRKEGDAKELQRIFDFNDNLEKNITERLAVAYNTTKQLIEDNSHKIDNTLAKILICDSQGQHKNNKNKQRMLVEDIETVEVQSPKREEEVSIFDLY